MSKENPVPVNPHMPSHPITSLSDLMLSIQKVAEDVRSGVITEKMAQVLLTAYKHNLKGAELNLQHRRMMQGKQPDTELMIIDTKLIAEAKT